MKPSEMESLAILALVGVGAYLVYRTYSAVADFGRDVADTISHIPDDFVKVPSPEAGTVPQWSGNRDTTALFKYFLANGIGDLALNEARKAGWTRDEINDAASGWAYAKRQENGDWY